MSARIECPVCFAYVAVFKTGRLEIHHLAGTSVALCNASGLSVLGAEALRTSIERAQRKAMGPLRSDLHDLEPEDWQ